MAKQSAPTLNQIIARAAIFNQPIWKRKAEVHTATINLDVVMKLKMQGLRMAEPSLGGGESFRRCGHATSDVWAVS